MSPQDKDDWVEAREAADIISKNSNHNISPAYVRLMATVEGRIQWKPKDKRQNYYLKSDVEKIVVKPRQKRKAGLEDTSRNGGSEKAA